MTQKKGNSPQSDEIALLELARFNLHKKYFLRVLLRQGKDQNKRGKV